MMNTRNAIALTSKMLVSTVIIGMCVVHIASNRTQEHQKLYLTGLVAAIAYLLPSPQISTDEKLM